MDPSDLEGYLGEICQHCWLALVASMQLRDLLELANERAGELARSDVHRVWRLQCWPSTEAILSSGAALSRLLWPPDTSLRDQVRGARLRSTLGVDGPSPCGSLVRATTPRASRLMRSTVGWLRMPTGTPASMSLL